MNTRLEAFLLHRLEDELEETFTHIRRRRFTLTPGGESCRFLAGRGHLPRIDNVFYIRYSIGLDHNGEPGCFFKVVMIPTFTYMEDNGGLQKFVEPVQKHLNELVADSPFFPYMNVRTKEECEAIGPSLEPEWEPPK